MLAAAGRTEGTGRDLMPNPGDSTSTRNSLPDPELPSVLIGLLVSFHNASFVADETHAGVSETAWTVAKHI